MVKTEKGHGNGVKVIFLGGGKVSSMFLLMLTFLLFIRDFWSRLLRIWIVVFLNHIG